MTALQNKQLAQFNKAKTIALEIGTNLMRRAEADSSNPFWGANLHGETYVIWLQEDEHLAWCKWDMKMQMSNKIWFCRKVAFYSILEG
jgi:hypothetical protein